MFDSPDGRHSMRNLPDPRGPLTGERPGLSTWRPPYASRGRSRWHWLLLIPIVVPLCTPLYNRVQPELLGVPFFYWCQLAFPPFCVVVITLVGLAARKRD